MSLLKKILETKSDKQLDTRDMLELESEESAAKRKNQQGQGLEILTARSNAQQITNYFSSIKTRK